MRATAAAITTIAGLLSFAALPASAEMGPCRPDKFNGLICSAGPGAARVIDDTLSPDNRFAFGWRTPNGDPTRQPTEAIEFCCCGCRTAPFWPKAKPTIGIPAKPM
jgi:hypothetical protein